MKTVTCEKFFLIWLNVSRASKDLKPIWHQWQKMHLTQYPTHVTLRETIQNQKKLAYKKPKQCWIIKATVYWPQNAQMLKLGSFFLLITPFVKKIKLIG